MLKIDAERCIDRPGDGAERSHVIGERGVAIASNAFRPGDRGVDIDAVASRQPTDAGKDGSDGTAGIAPGDEIADRNRPGVDERIARTALFEFELDDRVEGTARRFPPDQCPHRIAVAAQRFDERKHLADRLDGKRRVGIARHNLIACRRYHRDTEMIDLNSSKFRDIVRHSAALGCRRQPRCNLAQRCRQIGHFYLSRHHGGTVGEAPEKCNAALKYEWHLNFA